MSLSFCKSLHCLQAYSNNLVDHHIILDLLPSLAQAYFSQHIPVNLSYLQAAILLSLGLQQNEISTLQSAIQLPANQALALFNKVCPIMLLPFCLALACNKIRLPLWRVLFS